MSDRNNELNDIILDGKHEKEQMNKRIFIGIATLALLLIVGVIILGRIMHTEEETLPDLVAKSASSAPVFEETINEAETQIALDDSAGADDDLDRLTDQIKNQLQETEIASESAPQQTDVVHSEADITIIEPVRQKPEVSKPASKPAPAAPVQPKSSASGFYVQVGAFSTSQPGRSLLKKIEKTGLSYSYHKVNVNGKSTNKVLVGPFKNRAEAVGRLPMIHKEIEPGAFIYIVR